MSVELTTLAWATALLIVLVVIQAAVGVAAQGVMPMSGHRDNLPPPKPFQARTKRVVDNHREGLTMFAPLVLIAAVANIHSGVTVLGAELFFWSRLAHAVLYLAGIPFVRPLAWAGGIAGTIMMLTAVLGLG